MKRNLLLAVCSFLVALALVEVGLRATHAFDARVSWTEPDPELGWRLAPGRAYWFFNENDHAVTGRINRLGWRDHERSRTKAVGTMRVAVLGDSYVEAFQVELDSTFVAIAERVANARVAREKRRYEFMNFGRSGMGSVEESIVLRREVLLCDPDVVVLVFTPGNDVAEINPATTSVLRPFYRVNERDSLVLDSSFRNTKGYRVRALMNPLKQHSALVSLVAERYNASRAARLTAPAANGRESLSKLQPEQALMTEHPDSTYLANYALVKRVIAGMARDCASRGVAFVLTSVPLVYQDTEVARLRGIDASFDPAYFDRDLAAMADTSGFAFLPLTEAFSAHWRKTEEPLHWAHWNYRGHRLVGELLAEAVTGFGTDPLPRR